MKRTTRCAAFRSGTVDRDADTGRGPLSVSSRWCVALAALLLSGGGQAQVDGLWRGQFGGVALSVEGERAEIFQVTQSTRWSLDRFKVDSEGKFITGDGRSYRLVLTESGLLNILDGQDRQFLVFEKTETLPAEVSPSDDPGIIFDVLWESFAENHALFAIAGVDWESQRGAWRERALNAPTAQALFEELTGLLAPLNDRHSTLVWPETSQVFRSGPASDPFWQGRENRFLLNIADRYLGVPLKSRQLDPRLRFGQLTENLAYLNVSNFLDGAGSPAFSSTLDLVLEELRGSAGLILDLRFNSGGVDNNSLELLRRLVPPDQSALYVRQRRLSGPLPARFGELEIQSLAPLENPWEDKPLVVLTAGDTASAAETVLLALLGAPRVIQVGETTAGVFSNLLFRYLPNGWFSTLSNEQFFSINGRSFEQRGIPPMIPVPQTDYDLDAGIDAALERGIAAALAQAPRPDSNQSPNNAISGLWFDPERDGEGWHLQRIDEERVFVTFYSFGAVADRRLEWMVGLGTESDGVLTLERLLTSRGGRFGDGAGAAELESVDWGRARLFFESCDKAVAEVSGPDDFRGHVFRLQRLTSLPGLGCDGIPAGNARAPELAGSWYLPSRSGEGWLISHTSDAKAVVSWYTFDQDGQRAWFIGEGSISEQGALQVASLYTAGGARYGQSFEPGDVDLIPNGSLNIKAEDCGNIAIVHTAESGGEELVFAASRLTSVQGWQYPPGCE